MTCSYRVVGKDPHFRIWHMNEGHALIYTYSSGGSIVCKEKVYPITEGALCFIAAGKYHYTMPDDPAVYERSKLIEPPEHFSHVIGAIPGFAEKDFVYAQIPPSERDAVDAVFREIHAHASDRHGCILLLAGIARLSYYLDRYATESIPSESGFMDRAVAYINDRIFTDISIDGICAHVHMSKYYFCRRFKEAVGVTVMQYVLKTRLTLAKNMLRDTSLSIGEISEQCGFSSPSYFCRAFKEESGISPSRFRRGATK